MINRKIFDKVLKRIKKVIGCNGHMPILRCVKLEGDGEILTISGTSIQVSAMETIPAPFMGSCCVNLKELMTALKGMNGSDISLEPAEEPEGGGKLSIISADGSRCSLSTLPTDEFPTIINMDEGKACFSMGAEVLGGVLKRCYPFVSDDESRPYICGIHMLTTGDFLRMEAVDGHRLILETMIPCNKVSATNVILPRDAIPALIDKVNGNKGFVDVRGSENHVLFGFENGYIAARKQDAEFPPVASVIPENPVIACRVSRKELFDAAKSAKAVAENGGGRSVSVELHVGPERLKVAVDLPHTGGGFEKTLAVRSNGWMVMGFAPAYLVDAMQVLEEETVVMEMTDAFTGMRIKEKHTTIVIMPIRLGRDEQPVIETPISTIMDAAEKTAQVSAA